jgi:transcriptional regulator with XRE-family HTH domain
MPDAITEPSTVALTDAADMLRQLRMRAGISQRELGRRMGVPQPSIARWEAGGDVPRWDTIARFATACGFEIDLALRAMDDVDRAQIREHLRLTPAERLQVVTNVARFRARARLVDR